MIHSANRGPRTYFSFRSPYSWLAYRDIRERYPELLEALTWIPYWDPDEATLAQLHDAGGDYAYVPMSREKHRYLLQDVRRQAARRDLTISWPLDSGAHWEPSHVGYFVAAEHGLGVAYIDRVFTARWCAGRSIHDPAVIAEIAAGLGLPGGDVASASRQPRYRDRAIDALVSAFDDDVFGPPMFVVGREKYWGLDRLDDFVTALRRAPKLVSAEIPDVESAYQRIGGDVAHAGGCG